MSNEEYTHQNFWKKETKFITIIDRDLKIHFTPLPVFDEPFCKQVKKKEYDKTV
ncbi:MAG TPA: hypothetical protein PLT51_01305 [Candidatus Dojkabacteria bacterium]|nr:hypothetical protein [Candidatus Dojkabacteria bacterium]